MRNLAIEGGALPESPPRIGPDSWYSISDTVDLLTQPLPSASFSRVWTACLARSLPVAILDDCLLPMVGLQ